MEDTDFRVPHSEQLSTLEAKFLIAFYLSYLCVCLFVFVCFEQLQLLVASNFHGCAGASEVLLALLFKNNDLCEGPENKHYAIPLS